MAPGYYTTFDDVDVGEGGSTFTFELEARPDPVAVTGEVVDESTGEGIDGAEVQLDGPPYHELTTEADGSFSAEVIPGDYEVSIQAEGYYSESISSSSASPEPSPPST